MIRVIDSNGNIKYVDAPNGVAAGSYTNANITVDATGRVTMAASGNPMTTAGDLIIGGTAGAPSRLGIGTTNYVLTVISGAPSWQPAAGGTELLVDDDGAILTDDTPDVLYDG